MFKHMIRWIVVLATLLIIATALVLTPTFTHAAGTHSHTTQATTATPTSAATGGMITPDFSWSH